MILLPADMTALSSAVGFYGGAVTGSTNAKIAYRAANKTKTTTDKTATATARAIAPHPV